MASRGWRDLIVSDRMAVDGKFADELQRSGFSRNEWGMVMTAVTLEVEGEGEEARLVADTTNVDAIMPELERVSQQLGGGGGGGGGPTPSGGSGGGLLDSIKSSLGLGGGSVGDERREEAIRLADAYASALQAHLEENGRWAQVRDLALDERRAEPE